jgi:hypothetical protein
MDAGASEVDGTQSCQVFRTSSSCGFLWHAANRSKAITDWFPTIIDT